LADPFIYAVPSSSRSNSIEYIPRGDSVDTLLESNEGDFVLGADGDLLMANENEAIAQSLIHAIRTHKNSSKAYRPDFGTRLRNALGLPNSDAILNKIKDLLVLDLESSGLSVLNVEVLPLKEEIIMVRVEVLGTGSGAVEGTYLMNTETGYIEIQGGLQV